MKFEIDNEAIELDPNQTSEYNSKLINMHENLRLIHGRNCIITSFDQKYYQIKCIGDEITPQKIRSAILKANSQSKYNFLLSFIKRKNGALCLNIKQNMIEIDLYFPIPFFKNILESYLIPIQIGKKQLSIFDNKVKFNGKNEFIVNRDQNETLRMIKERFLTYTCFSHPNFKISKKKNSTDIHTETH